MIENSETFSLPGDVARVSLDLDGLDGVLIWSGHGQEPLVAMAEASVGLTAVGYLEVEGTAAVASGPILLEQEPTQRLLEDARWSVAELSLGVGAILGVAGLALAGAAALLGVVLWQGAPAQPAPEPARASASEVAAPQVEAAIRVERAPAPPASPEPSAAPEPGPEAARAVASGLAVELPDLHFGRGEWRVDASAVRNAASHCAGHIEITGHTCALGSEATNLAVGLGRATAAKEALVAAGFAPTRLRLRSAGESEPIADNRTEAGRAANRRVTLRCVLGQ